MSRSLHNDKQEPPNSHPSAYEVAMQLNSSPQNRVREMPQVVRMVTNALNALPDAAAFTVLLPEKMREQTILHAARSWLPIDAHSYEVIPFENFVALPVPPVSRVVVVPNIIGANGLARLLAHVTAPLLVVPASLSAPGDVELLLADDLTSVALKAVAAAESMISGIQEPVELLHLHVAPPKSADQKYGQRLLDDQDLFLEARLNARGKNLKSLVEAKGGIYHADVWEGDVVSEIKRATSRRIKHLTVLGRHRSFHWHNFTFGRLPYAAMVAMQGALLLAP